MVFYQFCEIGANRIVNMAARANYVLWLVQISKVFLSETNADCQWIDSLQKLLLDGPVLSIWIVCRSEYQNDRHDEL